MCSLQVQHERSGRLDNKQQAAQELPEVSGQLVRSTISPVASATFMANAV